MSDSVSSHRRQPTRLPRPWDSPGKNTGVGCHFLLQCMKVKSESEVAQLCLTLSDLMDCSLPGSSVHGIFQARVLEWGAIAFSGPSHYCALNSPGHSAPYQGCRKYRTINHSWHLPSMAQSCRLALPLLYCSGPSGLRIPDSAYLA